MNTKTQYIFAWGDLGFLQVEIYDTVIEALQDACQSFNTFIGITETVEYFNIEMETMDGEFVTKQCEKTPWDVVEFLESYCIEHERDDMFILKRQTIYVKDESMETEQATN